MLDLDGTLINTPEIKRRFLRFLGAMGSSSRLLDEVRELFAHFDRAKYRRLRAMKDKEVRAVFRRYDRMLETKKNYNFPGMRRFLSVTRKTHELWLLTYGEPAIQRKKLRQSGIAHYFKKIIITDEPGKSRGMRAALRTGKKVFMIDDSELVFKTAKRLGVPAVLVPRGMKDAAYFRGLAKRVLQ